MTPRSSHGGHLEDFGPMMLHRVFQLSQDGLLAQKCKLPLKWFEERTYKPSDIVFSVGDQMPKIGIIIEGFLLVQRNKITVGLFGPGDLVGNMEFLHARRRYMKAKAAFILDAISRKCPCCQRTRTYSTALDREARDACREKWQAQTAVADGSPLCAMTRGLGLKIIWLNYEFVKYMTGHEDALTVNRSGWSSDEMTTWLPNINSDRRFEDYLSLSVFRCYEQNNFLRTLYGMNINEIVQSAGLDYQTLDSLSAEQKRKRAAYELLKKNMHQIDDRLGITLFPDCTKLLEEASGEKRNLIVKILNLGRRSKV